LCEFVSEFQAPSAWFGRILDRWVVNQVLPHRPFHQSFVYDSIVRNGIVEPCSGGDYLPAVLDIGAFDGQIVFRTDDVGPGGHEHQRRENRHSQPGQYDKPHAAPNGAA